SRALDRAEGRLKPSEGGAPRRPWGAGQRRSGEPDPGRPRASDGLARGSLVVAQRIPSPAGRVAGGGWNEPAGEAVASRRTDARMARMVCPSVIKEMIFIAPPQRGQTRGSTS